MTRVLFVHTAGRIGGGNKVALHLQRQLNRDEFALCSVIPERGAIEADLTRQQVPYLVADLRPDPQSPATRVRELLRVASFSLRHRIDILHGNDPLTYRAASLAAPFPWIRRVVTVHHPGVTRETLAWAFRRPPHTVIVPSAYMKRQITSLLAPLPKHGIEVVWNEIDTTRFSPGDRAAARRTLQIDPDAAHVCILGTLAQHKGHMCFLRAARRILAELPNAYFHIVGGNTPDQPNYRAELQTLAETLGIQGNVRFWGFADDDTALRILQASDLFMLPTHEEGFGLSVAEAQGCELPVLTSDISPLDEVVDSGRSGILLPPDDDAAFAAHAVDLLQSHHRRLEMGRHGRRWTVERFGQGTYARRVTAIYRAL